MALPRPSLPSRTSSYGLWIEEVDGLDPKSDPILNVDSIVFHLWSVWLFTFSDLKTIILPSTIFAMLHDLSKATFLDEERASTTGDVRQKEWDGPAAAPPPPPAMLLVLKLTVVLGWTWINLLPFAIDNQRQSESVAEDRTNKPWRPLPAGRMTQKQATALAYTLYPLAIGAGICCGAAGQSLALLALGIWYNDLGGADWSWLLRNFINACGFVCYTSGALQVALQVSVFRNVVLAKWFLVVGAVVFTTVQTQDMYDQEGDGHRGRRTAPLVLGDGLSRWTIAVPMAFWCFFCPWFWSMPPSGYLLPAVLGGTVSYRTLTKRTVGEDKSTFRLWNLWLVSMYTLPLVRLKIIGW